jgi:hypothetical protein
MVESIFEAYNSADLNEQIFRKKRPFGVFLLKKAKNISTNVFLAVKQMILHNVSLS